MIKIKNKFRIAWGDLIVNHVTASRPSHDQEYMNATATRAKYNMHR